MTVLMHDIGGENLWFISAIAYRPECVLSCGCSAPDEDFVGVAPVIMGDVACTPDDTRV